MPMGSRNPVTLACLMAAALAGCALPSPPAPDALRADALPHVATPPHWRPGDDPRPVAGNWLASFADPALDALVAEALAYNADLRMAAARVELAAGYAKLAGASIYPAVNILAHGGGKLGGDNSGINGGGLFVSWELDLWGRVRAQRAVGAAQYDAAVADAEYARQSIAAAVAKAWFLAIEAKLQHVIATDVVRSGEDATGLVRNRYTVGAGSEYDVELAQSTLASARDTERQLAYAEEQARRALEVLVGRFPAAELAVASSLPRVPAPIPAGLPSELLERRPDVIAAERRVAAAFNQVTEAKAARLPKISLTAGVTSISSNLFVLQDHQNPVASLGANLMFPLFNGYGLEAQVEIRTAEQAIAVADYGRVGLRAFNEVETAMSAAAAADDRVALLRAAVTSNARALDLAKVRYRVGSGDLRAVLGQGVTLYGSQSAAVRMQADQLVQRVNLYLALGGSFDDRSVRLQSSAAQASTSTGGKP
ncbi:MAG: TolC family protein [Proteobacteria bacterium]|nr:TolC family protein [Pseudomonadota bacterium]